MQSTSFLDTLKQLNSERKIAGKHPLLQMIPEMQEVRIAYFQGIVLAALCDDGEISPGEQERLRNLGIGLSLTEDDMKEGIETVRKIRSSKEQMEFLRDLAELLSDRMAAMLFLCEFIIISGAPDHDRKDLQPYVEAFAEYLKLAEAGKFFLAFCAFADAEGEARMAAADNVRKQCPEAFLPFLPYFFSGLEEPDKDSLLEDIKRLMNDPARDAERINAEELKNVLSQFLKSHPDVSEYQLMQMLLPVVKQKYATLKKAVFRAKGKSDRVDMRDLPSVRLFLRYVCLMDLLTVCHEDFMMIKAVSPPQNIHWTPVKEPENVAKEEASKHYGLYVKELEERCKR